MTSVEQVDAWLTQAREQYEQGLAPLPVSPLVTDAFRADPPHALSVWHLLLKPRFGLFLPTGVGKTPISLVAYGILRNSRPKQRLLIVTTKSALFQWQAECARFLTLPPAQVAGYTDTRRVMASSDRYQQYSRWASGELPILIMTYHILGLDRERLGPYLHPDITPPYSLVFDEVQHVRTFHRSGGGLLYPGARAATEHASTVWGLSATPMMNTIDDLYGVMEAIRPGTFGDFKKVFCARYYERQLKKIFVRGGGGATKRVWENIRPKNMDGLKKVLAPVTLRLPFAAFSSYLPAVQTRVVAVELMKQQRAVYDEIMSKRLRTDNGFDRLAKVTALLYAQMCVDAPLTVGARPDVNSVKQIELQRLLGEELRDRKVLVFSRFEQVVSLLCKDATAAGIPHVRITGVENAAARRSAQAAFQLEDKTRVCFLTTAGSEALNLHAADVVIFYDLPWTWGEFQQILGRARRLGSEHGSVLVLLLAALDTIDEVVLMNLLGKEHVTGALALDDAKVVEQLVNTHQPDVQFTDVQTATSVASFVDSAVDVIFEGVRNIQA